MSLMDRSPRSTLGPQWVPFVAFWGILNLINGLEGEPPDLYTRRHRLMCLTKTQPNSQRNPKVPLEIAPNVSDLNASNPAHSDGLNQADAHMRMIKAALKATFAHTGQLTNADNQMIPADGSSTKPTYTFASEPTLGFYRSAAGVITVAGGHLKGGLPVGGCHMFLVEPPLLGKGGTGTGYEYLELDGSTWPNSAFPDLANHLGQGGTTFTLPDAKTTGRFPRSRTASVAAGTAQANQNKTHTHTGSGQTGGQSADHYHSFSGTTGAMNQNASHAHSINANSNAGNNNNNGGGGGSFAATSSSAATITATNTDHAHSFSGNTSYVSNDHSHSFAFTTSNGSADGTEARPEALSFVFCIKT